jgi:hypothetical protein
MVNPREPDEQPPLPEVERVPARDKPIADYSDEEWKAVHDDTRRTLEQRERDAAEQRQREEAEANKTPEQLHDDALLAALAPGAKAAEHAAIVRSIHGEQPAEPNPGDPPAFDGGARDVAPRRIRT